MGPDGRLRVRVSDARGRPLRARGLGAWLERIAPARARGLVAIAIVSDARVRALNRRYRHIDRATDVLTFPANPERGSRGAGAPRTLNSAHRTPNPAPEQHPEPGTLNPEPVLGDIVIAAGVSNRQARARRHAHAVELRVLALHGLLHLLGYDHERDDGRMRRVEARLRRKGGLDEGLIERHGARVLRAGAGRRASKR